MRGIKGVEKSVLRLAMKPSSVLPRWNGNPRHLDTADCPGIVALSVKGSHLKFFTHF
jgi:hypothetical protein